MLNRIDSQSLKTIIEKNSQIMHTNSLPFLISIDSIPHIRWFSYELIDTYIMIRNIYTIGSEMRVLANLNVNIAFGCFPQVGQDFNEKAYYEKLVELYNTNNIKDAYRLLSESESDQSLCVYHFVGQIAD